MLGIETVLEPGLACAYQWAVPVLRFLLLATVLLGNACNSIQKHLIVFVSWKISKPSTITFYMLWHLKSATFTPKRNEYILKIPWEGLSVCVYACKFCTKLKFLIILPFFFFNWIADSIKKNKWKPLPCWPKFSSKLL